MAPRLRSALIRTLAVGLCVSSGVPLAWRSVSAQPQEAGGKAVYDQLKAFALTGGMTTVEQLVLKRDRVTMTFTGTFYFAAPVAGKVTGAVFVGEGTLKAEAPPSDFERDNLKRMIGADLVDTDFKTAVLRFTDDTFDKLSGGKHDGAAAPQAQRLAADFGARFVKETGANIASRIAISLLNQEPAGLFVGQFDGGRRGAFSYLLDPIGQIPVGSFNINGGEKGLIYAFHSTYLINEVWMAFYALQDYEKRMVEFSDANDLVDITNYTLNVDLRNVGRVMGLQARIDMQARRAGVQAIPFKIGESLSLRQDIRLKNQLRMRSAKLGAAAVPWVQEDWEGGFTVFLPAAAAQGQPLSIDVEFDGDFVKNVPTVTECFYPISNTSWLPRHGYLDRATFDTTFRHRKRDRIASVGTRVSEAADPQDPDATLTRYQIGEPIALITFAVGPWERKAQQLTWQTGGKPIPLEFNSVPPRVTAKDMSVITGRIGYTIKADFVLAELDNALQYFAAYFGRYPYQSFGAAFHPFGFGQGFPTMLMLPPADVEDKRVHAFIAHETAHQWWGNIVAWRSYRDQWLSEGFAEYSGMIYAGKRDREGSKAFADLIRESRETLVEVPRTALGVSKGRVNDIGPLVLGLRLNTSQSAGAYQTLIYQKGALVLRMLHFLFSDPATLNDAAFVTMMTDFVEKYRNKSASTEDFLAVANQHFANTPIGRKFQLRDLNWFFSQWVYSTQLPTYTLEYELKPNPDGSQQVVGVVKQDNAGPNWMMVLPVLFSFDNNQEARTTVRVTGASTPFELKLPAKPRKVELDPGSWVLSEKTITKVK